VADGPTTLGLNPAQQEAVEHLHGPILVLAGAGSGKTRVLTARIAHLLQHHEVPPERVFAVTFTNKAAGEMRGRVGALLRRDPAGLWIGTFHSLSARLLRRDAERLGFNRQFTIFDEADRLAVITRLLSRRGHPSKLFPPRVIQSLISSAKNRMESPEMMTAAATFDRVLAVAAEIYHDLGPALLAQNAMDFDDLMLHPLRLFREHPDRLAYWQQRFAFLLVDEFQDTNRAQYQLVRLLGSHGNVFAVGDDDQSIYGWRGAEVKNMRDFQADFAGTRLVKLEENYRSTQVVLDAANAVIGGNTGRLGKTLRTRRRGGEPITVLAAADERDEAEWVARELARRAEAGDTLHAEMAVLYRTNAQSRALEEAFRRAGVPHRVVGATSFYERREVKDLLAYLRVVANPADDEAFVRAIGSPKRGVGDASLNQLRDSAAQWGKSLLATAAIADRITGLRPNLRTVLTEFAQRVAGWQEESRHQPPAAILEDIIKTVNYEAHLKAEGPEGEDRWENVRELLAGAAQWSEVLPEDVDDETTPLERFLSEAALLSSHDKITGAEEGVTLMTLHTAKGLEWRVVVLAGMEDGLFPLGRALETQEGAEEERRLFYVGVTRARDVLLLTWARNRRRGGELRPGIASRFLKEVPAGLVDDKKTALGGVGSWSGGRVVWTSGDDWDPPARGGQRAGGPARVSGGTPMPRWTAPAPTEEVSQDAPRYVLGERVRHRRFGDGSIIELAGKGRDLKVRVQFDDEEHGSKQLVAAYAGLERVWEDG
jgi:DNA helicase-2/ATP-dependent DNA helicase PcrA